MVPRWLVPLPSSSSVLVDRFENGVFLHGNPDLRMPLTSVIPEECQARDKYNASSVYRLEFVHFSRNFYDHVIAKHLNISSFLGLL